MLATSKNYPELIFEVDRKGEESPDFEMIRFKDGAMESVVAELIWPPFDTILSENEQVQSKGEGEV
jgi:hypothetical protein